MECFVKKKVNCVQTFNERKMVICVNNVSFVLVPTLVYICTVHTLVLKLVTFSYYVLYFKRMPACALRCVTLS